MMEERLSSRHRQTSSFNAHEYDESLASNTTGLVRRATKKILKRSHLSSALNTSSNDAPTSPTDVHKDKLDAEESSRYVHHEDIGASSLSSHQNFAFLASSIRQDTATVMFYSSSAAGKVPCEHNTIFPDPDVDYKAEARKLTNVMLQEPRLSNDDISMLVKEFFECLAWPKTHQQAAYLHKKMSDMSEDFALVMSATDNQSVRRSLLHSLCMNARGMFNFFEMASAPIEMKVVDLEKLCPCNALGHACRIAACSYEHFCPSVGLDAKSRLKYGLLTTTDGKMPPPTICPGSCRLPHGLRCVDLVCQVYLDDPARHHQLFGRGDDGYGRCALGHGHPARCWAILEAHRSLCEDAAAVAPGRGDNQHQREGKERREEEREGERKEKEELEPPSRSGRRNPVGRLIEDAGVVVKPKLAESSKAGEIVVVGESYVAGGAVATPAKKKSRWNLRGLRR